MGYCAASSGSKHDADYRAEYPASEKELKNSTPIYETLPGWKTSLSGIKNYKDLPENAKKYIAKVEDLIGAPIGIISVGPDREQTIFID